MDAKQFELRRSGITATDAVILSGCSRWGHPLEVYEQKLGAPQREQTIAMAMGHAAEPVIVGHLVRTLELTVWPGVTVRDNVRPYFLATPDRFVSDRPVIVELDGRIVGERPPAVVEAKLVGRHLVGEWFDEEDPNVRIFPDSVATQTCWQMGVCRARRAHIGAMLGGWRDDDLHVVTVDFDEDLWAVLTEVADRFWVDHVLARRPPAPDASDRAAEALERLYPRVRRPVLERASDGAGARMRELVNLRAQRTAIEKREDLLKNELRAEIADAEGLISNECKATWSPMAGRVSVEKIREHLGWSEEQLEPFRGPGGRALRVNALTKREKGYVDAAE